MLPLDGAAALELLGEEGQLVERVEDAEGGGGADFELVDVQGGGRFGEGGGGEGGGHGEEGSEDCEFHSGGTSIEGGRGDLVRLRI